MLTMNPERSLVRIGCLPICCANPSARPTVSADVSSPTTTSTSFITGTGLKKCSPSTRSRRLVHEASCAIGIDEVFDAMIARSSRSSSRRWKTAPLHRHVLEDRLDDDLGTGEAVELGRRRNPAEQRLGLVGGELPASTARLTDFSIRSRERTSGAACGS